MTRLRDGDATGAVNPCVTRLIVAAWSRRWRIEPRRRRCETRASLSPWPRTADDLARRIEQARANFLTIGQVRHHFSIKGAGRSSSTMRRSATARAARACPLRRPPLAANSPRHPPLRSPPASARSAPRPLGPPPSRCLYIIAGQAAGHPSIGLSPGGVAPIRSGRFSFTARRRP